MAARALTRRTLNRTVLHRQLLLERSNVGLVRVVERTGGLLLPTWEALPLSHARHGDFLAAEYRDQVFNVKMPQSIPTFLIDGTVAGTWRSEGGRVVVTPFEPLPKRWRRDVEDEASALDAWLGGTL